MSINRRLIGTGVAAIALLSLSACAPEPGSPAPTASGTAAAPTPTATPPADPADCLVGDWYIEQDQLQNFYDAVAANSDGLSFQVEGGTGLSFAETSYVYSPEFSLLMDIAGMEGEGATSGTISGDYTTDAGVITTAHDESNVSLIVTIGDTASDASEVSGAMLSGAPINSAPYSCSAEGPVIQFSAGGETRVPVQLTTAE